MAILPTRPAPILPPQQKPLLPQAQPKPATVAPVAKKEETKKQPQDSGNGDVLVAEMGEGRHSIKIFEKKDPSQFIKFHGICSCGTECRFHQAGQAIEYMQHHVIRHQHDR